MIINGIELCEDAFAPLTTGADARVMTANILSEEWGGTECLPRAKVLAANLAYYSPDAVGAQEVSINWDEALATVLPEVGYAVLHEKVEGHSSNYCPIIYNTRTLDVIESGAYRLTLGGPRKARCVTWAEFELRGSSKRFILLNTHLDWIRDKLDYTTQGAVSHYSREMQVRELSGTYAELEARYPGVPILMCADWNTAKEKHPLNILTDLTGAKYCTDVLECSEWNDYEVDHIFINNAQSVVGIHMYRENCTDLGATDHPWGFVDISIK